MQSLEQPVQRHISGKLPTHSEITALHTHWQDLDKMACRWVLHQQGYVDERGKPQRKAVDDGLIDRCGRTALWNLAIVQEVFEQHGMQLERAYANQEPPINTTGAPVWANLGTIATYFGVSANAIGKWLHELEYRNDDGTPTKDSFDTMLVNTVQMNAGGKKTRDVYHWDLHRIIDILMEAGHPLNRDYEQNLKGRGKNSDVVVETLEDRVKDFTKTFVKLYKDPETRAEAKALARKTPRGILQRAEQLMQRPGFLTTQEYLKY